MAIVASAAVLPVAGNTAASALGIAAGGAVANIGASYASDAFKPALERISAILARRCAAGDLPTGDDLLRAIRQSHLDALVYVLAEFEAAIRGRYKWSGGRRGFDVRPFARGARAWVAGQRHQTDSADFAAGDGYQADLRAAQAVIQGTQGARFDTVNAAVSDAVANEAWNEFVAAMEALGIGIPEAFESYFFGPDTVSWLCAAQSFFAQRLKTDPKVQNVVGGMQFAVTIERLDTILTEIRAIAAGVDERFSNIERILGTLSTRGSEVPTSLDLDRLTGDLCQSVAEGGLVDALAREISTGIALGYGVGQTALQSERRYQELRQRPFFGRGDELERLDDYVASTRPGLMLVTAPPGTGKSSLLANWIDSRCRRDLPTIRHFISNRETNTTGPGEIAGHLVAQLRADTLARGENDGTRREELFALLRATSDPVVIVLDGLDEAAAMIERFVEVDLPANIRLILSGRAGTGTMPDYLKPWLELDCAGFTVERIELPPLDSEAIEHWLEEFVGHLPVSEMAALAGRLRAATEGLPLFLSYVMEDIATAFGEFSDGQAREDFLSRLPAPFAQYLVNEIARRPRDLWREPAWTRPYQRLFGLLARTLGPIRIDEIEAVFGELSPPDLADVHHRFSRWLSITGLGGSTRIAFAHPLLAVAFERALASDATDMGRRLLAFLLRDACEALDERRTPRDYALDWLGRHLALAKDRQGDAVRILASPEFLLAQLRDENEALRRLERSLADWHALDPATRDDSDMRRWTAFWSENETLLSSLANRRDAGDTAIATIVAHCLADCAFELRGSLPPPRARRRVRVEPSALVRSRNDAHDGRITGAVPFDDRLVSYGWDGSLRLWKFRTLEMLMDRSYAHIGDIFDVVQHEGRLASIGRDGALRLWNPETLECIAVQTRAHDEYLAVEILPFAGRLVTCGEDGRLRLWDSATLTLLRKRRAHQEWDEYGTILLGERLLTWGREGYFRLWDGVSLKRVAKVDGAHDDAPRGGAVNGVLAVGERLISYGAGWWIWDAATLKPLGHRWDAHDIPYETKLEHCAGMIVSFGKTGTLRLWDDVTFDPLAIREDAHSGTIEGVFALGENILTFGADGALRLWDARTLDPIASRIQAHDHGIFAVAVKNNLLLSICARGSMRAWNPETLEELGGQDQASADSIQGFASYGDRLVTYDGDGALKLWDTTELVRPDRSIATKGQAAVRGVATSNDRVGAWSQNGDLRFWTTSLEPLHFQRKAHSRGIKAVLPFGDGFLSYDFWGNIKCWAGGDFACVATRAGGDEHVSPHVEPLEGSVLVSEGETLSLLDRKTLQPLVVREKAHERYRTHIRLIDGKLFVGGSDSLKLWDANTLELLITSNEAPAHGVDKLLPLGSAVLGICRSTYSSGLRLFDPATLECLVSRNVRTREQSVASLYVVQVGERLLSRDFHGDFKLWDAKTLELLAELDSAHDGTSVYGMIPVGERVLSHGEDGTLNLWDADLRLIETKYRAHPGQFLKAFSSDRRLATCSRDGVLKIWCADTLRLLETIAIPGGRIDVAYLHDGALFTFGEHAFAYSLDE